MNGVQASVEMSLLEVVRPEDICDLLSGVAGAI